jgi:hypothetical protein
MSINNFDLLEKRLVLLEPGDFFPIIILLRRKDNLDMYKSCHVLYRSRIRNIEEFRKEQDKLIKICGENNARAYIKVNKRNEKDIYQRKW